MNEADDHAEVPVDMGFDQVFHRYFADTVRLAHLLTGSNQSSEDIAQEAFSRLHRHFDTVVNPAGYLRTTTVNLCRNWHRGDARESRKMVRHGLPTIDSSLGAEEMLDAVDGLPYRQRAVVVLRYWLDLREVDIADVLGCRPGTVKSLHTRALTRLRKVIPQ